MTTALASTTVDLWVDGSPSDDPAIPLGAISLGICAALRVTRAALDDSGTVIEVEAEGVPVQRDGLTGDLFLEPDRADVGEVILTITGEVDPDDSTAHAAVHLDIIDERYRLTKLGHATGEVDSDQIGGLHPIEVGEPGTCGESYHLGPLTDPIIARVWDSPDAQQVLRREHPAQLA